VKTITRATKAELAKGWEYAPAPEAHDYIKLRSRYGLFIGGKWLAPHSRKYFATINPATEEKLADVALGDPVDVDRAVKAARHAELQLHRPRPSAINGGRACWLHAHQSFASLKIFRQCQGRTQ